MMKNKAFQALALLVSATLFCGLAQAQVPVTVKSWAVDLTRTRSISSVSIGNNSVYKGIDISISGNQQPELSVYPTGSYWGPEIEFGDHRGHEPRRGGTFTSPPGWRGSILEYQGTDQFSVDWNVTGSTGSSIRPGKSLNYSVTVPKVNEFFPLGDPAYLNGHFTVGFYYAETKEGPEFWDYTGLMEVLAAPPSP